MASWITKLQAKLVAHSVEIVTGETIRDVRIDRGAIREIYLNNNKTLTSDIVIWSVPIQPLLGILGASKAPIHSGRLRKTIILNFISDQAPQVDLFYIMCHDTKKMSFRITLYSNIEGVARPKVHKVSVEVICSVYEDESNIGICVAEELAHMGIFPERAEIKLVSMKPISNGFPIPTKESKLADSQNKDFLQRLIQNTIFVGRGSGGVFYMDETLKDAYLKLSANKAWSSQC